MKIRTASTIVLALAASAMPAAMHASTLGSANRAPASVGMFATDTLGIINRISASPADAPPCDINNPSSCGVTGVGGCTNSPENPTVLLGVLGVSGLLVGRKTRSLLKRRRNVQLAA